MRTHAGSMYSSALLESVVAVGDEDTGTLVRVADGEAGSGSTGPDRVVSRQIGAWADGGTGADADDAFAADTAAPPPHAKGGA